MKIKHKIQVQGDKFKFLNAELFKRDLTQYNDQVIILTISKDKNLRSNNQNRYYWGVVVVMISDEIGYFPEEVHGMLTDKFLGYNISVKEQDYRTTTSTTRLNTTEFEDYLSKIRAWASMELSLYIPEPNEIEFTYEHLDK